MVERMTSIRISLTHEEVQTLLLIGHGAQDDFAADEHVDEDTAAALDSAMGKLVHANRRAHRSISTA